MRCAFLVEKSAMNPWLSALLIASGVGCVSFCLFYFLFLLRSSRSADLRGLEDSARRAFYRAAVLFGLTLLIVGFNPDLIPKITGFLTGRAPPGLARNGEIKVWAVTARISALWHAALSRSAGLTSFFWPPSYNDLEHLELTVAGSLAFSRIIVESVLIERLTWSKKFDVQVHKKRQYESCVKFRRSRP